LLQEPGALSEFVLESRGEIDVKGKGRMNTFWVHRITDLKPGEPESPFLPVDDTGDGIG